MEEAGKMSNEKPEKVKFKVIHWLDGWRKLEFDVAGVAIC